MSVRQIAAEIGVSASTVSRVLNNVGAVNAHTRELVLEAANRVGYAPPVGRRVITQIAFAYTQEMTISHTFDSAVLGGVIDATNECGYDVVVISLARDKRPDESYTQFFVRKGVRGVILRTMKATRAVCRAIADEEFPHVVISERFDSPNVNYIDGDSYGDTSRAVEYLISMGHRDIAFAMHNVPDRDHLDRLEGYRAALGAAGLPIREGLVFRQPFTLAGGATVMEIVMRKQPRPTAIVFADPMLGIGATRRAHEAGVAVPGDISIVGFDDADARFATFPTLTAVCQDAHSLGFQASLWLTRWLSGSRNGAMRSTVPTYFEVHGSTGPGPAAGSLGHRPEITDI
jgi:DNA-binding LacI/PurR family transcriptional regulator